MKKALDYLYAMKNANEQMGQEPININEAIKELEDLQSRSCENCKFNSSKNKNDELITCDLNKEFTNQRKIIFCGNWKSK